MKLVHCDNCGVKIRPDERRTGVVPTTWSEPGYEFDGCILCVGDEDREAAARAAAEDRQMDEERA